MKLLIIILSLVFTATSVAANVVATNNDTNNINNLVAGKDIVIKNSVEDVKATYESNTLTSATLEATKNKRKVANALSEGFSSAGANFFEERSAIEIGLEYPLHFGFNFKYYLVEGFYTRLGASFMSKFFLDSFVKVMPFFGHLNGEESDLISKLLSNSIYLDWRLGWSPYYKDKDGGPYLEVGVSRMFLGGGDISGLTLSKVLVDDNFNTAVNYNLRTNTVSGNFHIGYQVPLERLRFNVEVGVIKIINATFAKAQEDSEGFLGEKMNETQKISVKSFLEKKGWIFPTVSASIGLAF